ncbi:SDR family oxidoreductase [Amphritea sp. 2_MG-2023]|uniref:SDR family oxidoreductase n=1 Tax=Amphritea TaxID=515417 RepID=UPI001C07448B|nr:MULTISPECIES: SDR family oxidoreductase [Amphritea]MBU2964103.1 SDR family oxidoreductase [Amphritea atlantica]MDO6418501.1 SDR family oxidoreductase [Amphritea sp. 2_MG-2023]
MNNVAIITGGGSGIGRACALSLAARGLNVIVVGRRLITLQDTAANYPENITTVQADICTEEGRQSIVDTVKGRSISVLIHAAGVFTIASLAQLTPTLWEQSLSTNLSARLFLTQNLLENLTNGRILFIGSRSAFTPRQGATAYCVSQAASLMLKNCLNLELAQANISVGSLIPGPVDTQIMHQGIEADQAIYPDALQQRTEQLIAPETVGEFSAWLLLERSSKQFSDSQWDIRDTKHHHYWLKERSLYESPVENQDIISAK